MSLRQCLECGVSCIGIDDGSIYYCNDCCDKMIKRLKKFLKEEVKQ